MTLPGKGFAPLAALGGGALLPLGLAPFGWWPLALASTALLAWLLEGSSARTALARGFCYGVGLFAAGVHWVYVSIHHFGGEAPWIAFLLTAGLVALLAACFALPFAAVPLAGRGGRFRLLGFPALWLLGEWLRSWWLTGFPWLYLGYAFTDTPLAGFAPLGGVLGVGGLAAWAAGALVHLGRGGRWRLLPLAAVLAAWPAGAALERIDWTRAAGPARSVALVQPALLPQQKWDEEGLYQSLVRLAELSAPHWGVDLLVWPETAIPAPPDEVAPFLSRVDELARAAGTALVTGIVLREGGRYYNGVVVLGAGDGSYRKRHLVPFGEYLPLDRWLRGLIRFFDRPMSDFAAGPPRQAPLAAAGSALAVAICYEIVFSDLVARDAGAAQGILTLSNDVWFGDSLGPHQHLQMARMRALEHQKPVVRATNDGITALIDERGRVVARLPRFAAAALKGEFRPREGATPYARWGSRPLVVLALVLFALSTRRWSPPG